MANRHGYRLAPSTVVEPLVNRWVPWSDLISPAPYSLHLSNYQLNILASFCSNPELHARACQDAGFLGGPFINVPPDRVSEVQELWERTKREQAANIELASALINFSDQLALEAEGQSLEPYYARLPEPLQGYIELLYDYYNHPIVRPIEAMLYASPYYKPQLQMLRLFADSRDKSRPFFLSTPRLQNPQEVEWQLPFVSDEVDTLFELEQSGRPLEEIRALLHLDAGDDGKLLPLLTEQPGLPYGSPWEGPGVRLRYFGHACVLAEWNGITLLTDPWVSSRTPDGGVEHFSFADLPERIDFALITHGHHDHFVVETLLRLRRRIACLVVPRSSGIFYADTSLRMAAQQLGFSQVVEISELESIQFPGGRIVAVPFVGEHGDLPHAKTGYVISVGGQNIFFGADSNCLDRRMFEHIRRQIGDAQTVFLGMECVGAPLTWLYGAFLPGKLPRAYSQSRRTKGCNCQAALDIYEALGAKRLYVYAMGREPWLQYAMGLGLTEDSQQIQESNLLLSTLRERGAIDVCRPFGKFEVMLNDR